MAEKRLIMHWDYVQERPVGKDVTERWRLAILIGIKRLKTRILNRTGIPPMRVIFGILKNLKNENAEESE